MNSPFHYLILLTLLATQSSLGADATRFIPFGNPYRVSDGSLDRASYWFNEDPDTTKAITGTECGDGKFLCATKDGQEYRIRKDQAVIVGNGKSENAAAKEAKKIYDTAISPKGSSCPPSTTDNSNTSPPSTPQPAKPTAGGGLSSSPTQVGAVIGGPSEIRTVDPDTISQIQKATQLADSAQTSSVAQDISQAVQGIRAAAGTDNKVLSNIWNSIPSSDVASAFGNAARELDQMAQQVSQGTGENPAQVAADRNALLNARDKAQAAQELLAQDPNSPDINNSENALARKEALADLFGPTQPGSADSLADRMIMLAGLPKDKREQAMNQVQLIDNLALKLPNGKYLRIPIVHTGPYDPNDKTCEALMGSLLFTDARKWTFTTLDLEAMWTQQRAGELPAPTLFKKERAAQLKKTAAAFKAVHVYLGEDPSAGDLLVYHVKNQPLGQVYLVKDYNSKSMQAKAYAADNTGRKITQTEFNLSLDAPKFNYRSVRPGLTVLRPNPESNAACTYSDELTKNSQKKGGAK